MPSSTTHFDRENQLETPALGPYRKYVYKHEQSRPIKIGRSLLPPQVVSRVSSGPLRLQYCVCFVFCIPGVSYSLSSLTLNAIRT